MAPGALSAERELEHALLVIHPERLIPSVVGAHYLDAPGTAGDGGANGLAGRIEAHIEVDAIRAEIQKLLS